MRDFAESAEDDAHMYATFGDLLLLGFLQINTSSFDFLKFSTEH
jgi:hypothetical protein